MKKILFLASILAVAPLAAEEAQVADLSGGMWSNVSSNKIPANAAAYIQNFYTDEQPIAEERLGTIKKEDTVLGGGKAVTGLWRFVDSNANEWLIAFSSRTFYKSKTGTAFTSMGVIQTVDTVPEAIDHLGKIWLTNQTDDVWWFDGSSTGAVSSAPKGRHIEKWRNRIVLANVTGSKSTVRISADGDGESWTLGGNPTDPFSIEIGGANDGDGINCLFGSYGDTFIVGRKRDLWAVDGFDQADITVRQISDEVGCLEDRTMRESDGNLFWMSNRGVERMAGRQIERISEPVSDLADILVANATEERSELYTSQGDWEAGTQDPSGWGDTTTFAGDLSNKTTSFTTTSQADFLGGTFTASGFIHTYAFVDTQVALPAGRIETFFPDPFSTFRAGTTGLNPNAGDKVSLWWNKDGDSSVSGGVLTVGDSVGTNYRVTPNAASVLSRGTTFYVEVSALPSCVEGGKQLYSAFVISPYDPSTGGPNGSNTTGNCYYLFRANGDGTFNGPYDGTAGASSDGCPTLAGSPVSDIGMPMTFSVWTSTYAHNWSVNGNTTDGSGGGAGWSNFGNDYWYMRPSVVGDSGCTVTGSMQVSLVGIAPQVFSWNKTYDTAISSPTFDALDISTADVSAGITYTVASATATDGTFGSETSVADGGSVSTHDRVLRLTANFDHVDYDSTASSLNDATVGAYSTGTWTSSLINVGDDISSWSIVEITEIDVDGRITYQFGSTSTADVDSIVNWETIEHAEIPSIDVNPYAAFRSSFVPTASSEALRLQSLKINWNEGDFQPLASWVFDRRYMMSFSTVSSFNDKMLVWQKTNSWTLLDGINAASWATWRDQLYFGNSNDTGYVYQFGTGTSDDGADIESIIRFRSESFNSTFRDKEFKNLYVAYGGNTGFFGNFSMSYVLNQDGNSYALGSTNMNTANGQVSAKFPFPLSNSVRGREIQHVLNKNGTGDRLKLYDLTTIYEVKEEP